MPQRNFLNLKIGENNVIDYLTISFRKSDYRLKSSQNWILRRGNIVASENKSLDDNVFEMDNLTLKGHSMILNSDSFKINETPSGLYIQFNPSSYAYQGINFRTASYSEFVHCIDEIKSRLKEVVELDFESGTLHRIDLAKDIYPHFDFSYYIPVFQCLEGNRNSRNQKLGSTYWWSNEHKEVQFYDKKAQLKNLIPKLRGLTALQTQTWNELKQYNQILRVEVKLKKNYLIVRELKIETLAELLVPSIYDGLQDQDRKSVV